MGILRNRFKDLVVLIGMWGLWASGVLAAPSADQSTSPRRLTVLAADGPLEDSPELRVRDRLMLLRSKAHAQGKVRVIVSVRAPFAPELRLNAEQMQRQRQDIIAAQIRVEAGVLERGAAKVRRYPALPFVAMEVTRDQLEALASSPAAVDIHEDRILRAMLAESVPMVRANQVWNRGYTGSGWAVAVLDTGVQTSHPFVSGRILSEACYSTAQEGKNPNTGQYEYSLCPGGADAATGPGAASNCFDVSGRLWACQHGTHVAGIAAGNSNAGGVGYSGVAKGAGIIPIQVFFYSAPEADLAKGSHYAYTSDILAGLNRVYELRHSHPIAAVNMSLGGGKYGSQAECDAAGGALKTAIDNLKAAGIATIIASGNDGATDGLSFPACLSSAVSVGAVLDQAGLSNTCAGNADPASALDRVACYSNSATFLSVLAPGSVVQSSVPTNGYAYYQGTSMAAPHVAGCVALLRQAKPTATVDAIVQAIKLGGRSVTDWRNGVVTPSLDCDAALTRLMGVGGFALSVSKAGTGLGTVSSRPTGIQCGDTCLVNMNPGSLVTLTAAPATGSLFVGWSGACTGSGQCTIKMSAAKSVTANFVIQQFPLNVAKSGGNGSISGTNATGGDTSAVINCGKTCMAAYPYGASVVLSATPVTGYRFAGWTGACSGTGVCEVSITAARAVVANFKRQ